MSEGSNRLAAAHVSDAVRLYRLALERREAGARYHAVGEEGVPFRAVAEAIGEGIGLPIRSIAPEAADGYFGWPVQLAQIDLAASSAWTHRQLGWQPRGPDLLTDLRRTDFRAVKPQ